MLSKLPYWCVECRHYNGDQTARRPHMMCLTCGRRFTTLRFWVRGGRGWVHSTARPLVPISSLLTHMVDLLPYIVFFASFISYFAGSKRVFSSDRPIRPTGYDNKYRFRSSLRRAAKSQTHPRCSTIQLLSILLSIPLLFTNCLQSLTKNVDVASLTKRFTQPH